ncbi:ferritin, lower subunit-like isoform X2 [Mobula birostris]|uniref:ferritin, lower subunit-like isoform X2 n=1 Tax=Mobula birostris TaxID=1983395 RepID=UPI003B28949E
MSVTAGAGNLQKPDLPPPVLIVRGRCVINPASPELTAAPARLDQLQAAAGHGELAECVPCQMQSQVRQNLHQECEVSINQLISLKYYTSYVYLAMSFYFEQDDVALENFAKSFHEMSEAEHRQAENLIEYQKLRGGRLQLQSIKLCSFLETNFLNSNVEFMKKLGDHVTSLKGLTVGRTSGMGEYLFDKHTLDEGT